MKRLFHPQASIEIEALTYDRALGQVCERKMDIPHPLVTLASKDASHEMA